MYCRARSGRRERRILPSFSLGLPARSFRSSKVPFSEERCKGRRRSRRLLYRFPDTSMLFLLRFLQRDFLFSRHIIFILTSTVASRRDCRMTIFPLRLTGYISVPRAPACGPANALSPESLSSTPYLPPPTSLPRRHFPLSDFFVQSRVNGSSRRRPRNRFFYIYTRWINRSCMRVIAKNG